jgi:hypothetical protein
MVIFNECGSKEAGSTINLLKGPSACLSAVSSATTEDESTKLADWHIRAHKNALPTQEQHSLTVAMSFFGFDTSMPPGMQQGGGDSLDERLRRMAEADENL